MRAGGNEICDGRGSVPAVGDGWIRRLTAPVAGVADQLRAPRVRADMELRAPMRARKMFDRRMEAAAEEEEEPALLSWGIWEEEEERRGKSPGTSHACLEVCSLHSRGVCHWRLEWRREMESSRARDGRGPHSPAPLIFFPHIEISVFLG
jgi:hypothetical protein